MTHSRIGLKGVQIDVKESQETIKRMIKEQELIGGTYIELHDNENSEVITVFIKHLTYIYPKGEYD